MLLHAVFSLRDEKRDGEFEGRGRRKGDERFK
jgi:hypothetical protein